MDSVFALLLLTSTSLTAVHASEAESNNPTISTGGVTALVLLVVFSVILLGSCIYQSRKIRSADTPENRVLRCGGCRRAFRVPTGVDGAEFMCTRCVTEGRRRMSVVLDEERNARFEKMRASANKPVQLERVTSTFFKVARGSIILPREGAETEPGTPESLECKICFDDESCIVLLPCGHGSLCEGCAKDLVTATKECYICRTEIELIAKIRKPCVAGAVSSSNVHACLVAPDTLHHLTSRIIDDETPLPSPQREDSPALTVESSFVRRNTRMTETLPETILEEPTGLEANPIETV